MIVDVIRSCYSTQVRLFRDSLEEHTMTWYWAEPHAGFLPFPTVFHSRNWDDPRTVWPAGRSGPPAGTGHEVGEVIGAERPWRDGSNPVGLQGHRPAGTADDFAQGLLYRPLVFENVCFVIGGATRLFGTATVQLTAPVPDPPVTQDAFAPFEGCEEFLRSGLGLNPWDTRLRLALWTSASVPVDQAITFADVQQPFGGGYNAVSISPADWTLTQTAFGWAASLATVTFDVDNGDVFDLPIGWFLYVSYPTNRIVLMSLANLASVHPGGGTISVTLDQFEVETLWFPPDNAGQGFTPPDADKAWLDSALGIAPAGTSVRLGVIAGLKAPLGPDTAVTDIVQSTDPDYVPFAPQPADWQFSLLDDGMAVGLSQKFLAFGQAIDPPCWMLYVAGDPIRLLAIGALPGPAVIPDPGGDIGLTLNTFQVVSF